MNHILDIFRATVNVSCSWTGCIVCDGEWRGKGDPNLWFRSQSDLRVFLFWGQT